MDEKLLGNIINTETRRAGVAPWTRCAIKEGNSPALGNGWHGRGQRRAHICAIRGQHSATRAPRREFADILHFELCWLDGTQGDRVVPHLHLLGRGNVYVVITTTNVHFVARVGVDPTVATLPLCEIRQLMGKARCRRDFSTATSTAFPDAMRVAKCFRNPGATETTGFERGTGSDDGGGKGAGDDHDCETDSGCDVHYF